MWGLLRSLVGWSDAECRSRMRIARLVDAFDGAGELLFDGRVSVAYTVHRDPTGHWHTHRPDGTEIP